MKMFHFTFEVSGIDPETEGFEDRFYGGGVDDASILVDNGKLLIGFDREAEDQESAIKSAAHDVEARGGHVTRVVIDRDL